MKKKIVRMKNEPNVLHSFLYHCEIQYETQDCFGMTAAMGNTKKELLKDIEERFNYYKDRSPKIMQVLKNPNNNPKDITDSITYPIEQTP